MACCIMTHKMRSFLGLRAQPLPGVEAALTWTQSGREGVSESERQVVLGEGPCGDAGSTAPGEEEDTVGAAEGGTRDMTEE